MLLDIFRKLKEQIDDINFQGLEEFDMGSAFTIELYSYVTGKRNTVFKSLKMIIVNLFFNNFYYDFSHCSNSTILLLFSQNYASRADLKRMFDKVGGVINKADFLIAESKPISLGVRIKKILLLYYAFIWYVQMKSLPIDFVEKIHLITRLMSAKEWLIYMNHWKYVDNYKLLVTFCDAHFYDNLTAQYFKNRNIYTATLQHGWTGVSKENNISIHFEGLVSNQYLVWGEYIKQCGIRSGIDTNKLICLGNPKYINNKFLPVSPHNRVFAIFMSRSVNQGNEGNMNLIENNRKLLNIANSVCKRFSYKYILKFHPVDDEKYCDELYRDIVKKDFFDTAYYGDYSNEKILDKAEFGLVGSGSTVFLDLLYMCFPAFIFVEQYDSFEGIEWGKFHNVDELSQQLTEWMQDTQGAKQKILNAGELFNGEGDIAVNYQKYFQKYSIM